MNLQGLLDIGESITLDVITKRAIEFALVKLGSLAGPLGWLVSFLIKIAIKYFIWPAIEDLVGEGKLIFEKIEIDKKVKELENATSLADIDSAFADLP